MLQTDYGALVATGALAALVTQPLRYPAHAPVTPLLPRFDAAGPELLPLVSGADAAWALRLDGRQGQIGVLLLGRRRGDGLYTEEEIAIARAVDERLLDLTRAQWAESQVADRQVRRVLHDALIMLSHEPEVQAEQAVDLLAAVHRQTSDLLRALPVRSPARPSGHLLEDLRRLVTEEMAPRFDSGRFAATADASVTAARLRPLTAAVTFYAVSELVRNAARYGRSDDAPLALTVTVEGGAGLTVAVQDNGKGGPAFDADASAGQGLALHAALLAIVGGTLSVAPGSEGGMCSVIQVQAEPA